jgi:DNA-binding CsgD family transcriptional regulator
MSNGVWTAWMLVARRQSNVTVPPKQAKYTDVGGTTWVTQLAKCIDSIGEEEFSQNMIDALKKLVDIDYSVVFAYYKNERPLCLFHTFSPEKKAISVDAYQKGPYMLDPFFKACNRQIETGLYRIRDIAPDRFYQSEYYRSYYNQTGLSDEICYTFYLGKNVAVVISLMRSDENSRFSAREFRLLVSVVPVIVSLAQRHWQSVPNQFDLTPHKEEQADDYSKIESTVSAMFHNRLTPRETQVVAQVLEGHSSDSIARDLGISVGTVRIHRRNIYAKLQISSQQELFAIFLKNITAKGGEKADAPGF